ncbi:MAG: DNA methyltransferase [Acidimicrobiaceae bacterium]|nr:DNA methyltransferase [Acidimicrobiaceae bacterium]
MQPDNPNPQPAFRDAVHEVLESIGPGEVLSYGEVAEEAGFPRSARAVGRFLRDNSGYPWWRIVTANGRLVPGSESRQAALLESEGIKITNGHVADMNRNHQ